MNCAFLRKNESMMSCNTSNYLGLFELPASIIVLRKIIFIYGWGVNLYDKIQNKDINQKRIKIEPFDFVKTIALARILMPKSYVRLSAGRESMSDEMQALCFMAGANSIFYGDKLLTDYAKNPEISKDEKLFERLNLKAELVC